MVFLSLYVGISQNIFIIFSLFFLVFIPSLIFILLDSWSFLNFILFVIWNFLVFFMGSILLIAQFSIIFFSFKNIWRVFVIFAFRIFIIKIIFNTVVIISIISTIILVFILIYSFLNTALVVIVAFDVMSIYQIILFYVFLHFWW